MTISKSLRENSTICGGRYPKTLYGPSSGVAHDLVQRAEMIILSQLDRPSMRVASLAAKLGVSVRTLRKEFKRANNVPPCHHLRLLRLRQTRRALLAADNEVTTVTEVAVRFGFTEFGRFASEYRKVFGETPSVTLRGVRCAKPAEKDDADVPPGVGLGELDHATHPTASEPSRSSAGMFAS